MVQSNGKNNGHEELEIIEADSTGIHPRNFLNDLTSKEWIPETVSVWTQKGLGAGHEDTQIEKEHPAPFSFTDVARLIRFFTKSGQVVLDPFVGVGSTLKACAIESRCGIGFELNEKYAELARLRLEKEVGTLFSHIYPQEIHIGDSRELVPKLSENSIDFIVTSPPYWNILHKQDHKVRQERIAYGRDTKYGDNDLDLGNIDDYNTFLQELAKIFGACAKALKPKKYMAVIVSDFREKSKYVMFHAHLADALQEYGFELKGITVLYQRHKGFSRMLILMPMFLTFITSTS